MLAGIFKSLLIWYAMLNIIHNTGWKTLYDTGKEEAFLDFPLNFPEFRHIVEPVWSRSLIIDACSGLSSQIIGFPNFFVILFLPTW